MVDALASRADEGRGMAAISFGEPRVGYDPKISEIGKPARTHLLATALRSGTRRTETSKYPQEKKENSTPSVAASEGGQAQTDTVSRVGPLRYRGCGTHWVNLQAQRSYQSGF